ncbi:MAG: histidine phosphatase family protein [Pseudomonas sp.]|uniref:lipopolysaccharide core heptose(II)-phosphate phosphatase PmrG n=1 Tax=Pseudomonas abieticivorans TaxID=2931382 RepID=UPI0020C0EA7C|nr:histidine phosphatase family protein [Pseudomonas sp. PIA16]MDE1168338.1 histidine phosphatase family protein [Pseudomonas sp.]
MESVLKKYTTRYPLSTAWLRRQRRVGAAVLACLLVALSVTWLLGPATPANLAHANALQLAHLHDAWAKGEVIVLVRHAERCDHSSAQCLGQPDGITVRGMQSASNVAPYWQRMNLATTDIYTSPMTRAEQTAHYMFGQANTAQDWLSTSCSKSMMQTVLAHKTNQRNLIVVTHSECIARFERSLELSDSDEPGYGSALFVTVNSQDESVAPLGRINAEDWNKVIHN